MSSIVLKSEKSGYLSGTGTLTLYKVEADGGRKYQAIEAHAGHVSSVELNVVSQRFYYDMQERYYDERPNGQCAPNMASAHKHGEYIFYSSSERVMPRMAGMGVPCVYRLTAQAKTEEAKAQDKTTFGKQYEKWKAKIDAGKVMVNHNANGKCSEGGTCQMVVEKHGDNVKMTRDKISSLGVRGPGAIKRHHEGCLSKVRTFGCHDVLSYHGIDDVNKPGR
ncbi:hypothetical protein MMC14_008570 [Varicellaria rhodocarpa]|nr:hypothetical protein [Varicellaria rhodocarpa]